MTWMMVRLHTWQTVASGAGRCAPQFEHISPRSVRTHTALSGPRARSQACLSCCPNGRSVTMTPRFAPDDTEPSSRAEVCPCLLAEGPDRPATGSAAAWPRRAPLIPSAAEAVATHRRRVHSFSASSSRRRTFRESGTSCRRSVLPCRALENRDATSNTCNLESALRCSLRRRRTRRRMPG
jgi:hypothetical protein